MISLQAFRRIKLSLEKLRRNPFIIVANADRARDQKRWADAITLYEEYLNLKPDDSAIWIQLGHCRKESGDFNGASEAYEKARALAPDDGDLYLQIGHLRKLQGLIPEACIFFRHALEKDPQLEGASRELAFLAPPPEPLHAKERINAEEWLDQNLSRLLQHTSTLRALSHESLQQAKIIASLHSELARALTQIKALGARQASIEETLVDYIVKFGALENNDESHKRWLSDLAQQLTAANSTTKALSKANDAVAREGLDGCGRSKGAKHLDADDPCLLAV